MNCEQVARRLSEYLDRSLDPASTGKIESHLACCERCRTEVDLLLECGRQITALPQVEPPIAFAQRIIAHVKELECKPSFWESLFLPFKATLPIQVTATVLIGIIAVYIAEQEPHRKFIMPSRQTFAAGDKAERSLTIPARSVEENIRPAESGKKPNPEANQKRASSADILDRKADSRAERALKEKVAAMALPTPTSRLDSSGAPGTADPSGPLQPEASASRPRIAQSGLRPRVTPTIPVVSGAGGFAPAYSAPAARDLLDLMAAEPFGSAAVPSAFERLAVPDDIELVVRRRPQQSAQTRDSREPPSKPDAVSVPHGQAGRIIEDLLLRLRESSIPQTIWLALPRNQYDRLKSELLGLGTIESESPKFTLSSDTAAGNTDAQLRLTIIVLPADDGEAARTAGSSGR